MLPPAAARLHPLRLRLSSPDRYMIQAQLFICLLTQWGTQEGQGATENAAKSFASSRVSCPWGIYTRSRRRSASQPQQHLSDHLLYVA
jgi:hypothetical protein